MSCGFRRLGGLALAVLLLAAAPVSEAAAVPSKQFFRQAPALAKVGRDDRAPGVVSDARPVQFNVEEMLDLRRGDEIQLTLPDAAPRTVVFEHAQSHGGGIHSWVGHFKGRAKNNRVIVTTGPGGSYGVIDTPEGSFRIVPGGAHDWLVDMALEEPYIPKYPAVDDGIEPPASAKSLRFEVGEPTFEHPIAGKVAAGKASVSQVVVDLMVVMTQTLATRLGTNTMTRLHFLITRANQSYADSDIGITLRLVKLAVVNYSDVIDNNTAINEIIPIGAGGVGAFASVEAQRAAAGADLVTLMRDGSAFGGSGLASVGIPVIDPRRMYSVITGCVSGCESVFIHELGHNMGNKHDRFTNAWQSGSAAGAFAYSFGYAFCKTGALTCTPDIVTRTPGTCTTTQPECSTNDASNFRDIMAYFHASAGEIYRFSNPSQLDCATATGDGVPRPCGIIQAAPNSADTAHSMNNTRIEVSGLKSQVSAAQMPGSLQFTQTSYVGSEASGVVTFTVSRVRDSTLVGGGGAVSVGYTLAGQSATAGTDFAIASGTVNWADGDFANKTFGVTITNDMVAEGVETFTATLGTPAGAPGVFLGYPTIALGVIPDIWPPGGAVIPTWTTPSGGSWAVNGVDLSFDGDGTSLKSAAVFPCPTCGGQPPPATATQFSGVFVDGTIAFAYRVNSYPSFGFFEFLVDGVVARSASGDSGWQFFSMPITAGWHLLQWRYRPTLSFPCNVASPAPPQGGACADRAWIDTVALPLAVASSDPPRLGNISTRMQTLTGSDVMIGGFVIGGSSNKTVVVRARGPSLIPFGIPNALANPFLQLVRSSDQSTLATNDNWGSAPNAAAITASGFAPGNANESAILMTLPPGAYTAIVSGIAGGTGVAIVEVFEVDLPTVPLVNISTRGQVRTGNDVMIGGFVIQGDGPQTVVVRARGPSLIPFGIANALANPSLQLVRSSDQVTIATNDDWASASNAPAVTASGFAPSNALESAILITLQPGAYTAIVSGVGGGIGVGIVEVFVLP